MTTARPNRWGNTNLANNIPTHTIYGIPGGTAVLGTTRAGTAANNHGNTMWGVPVTAITANASHRAQHAGWNYTRRGLGFVNTFTITAGGTGYSNLDLVKVSGGVTNAAATILTNGSGVIVSVNTTAVGTGFVNVSASTLAITNTTGGTANGTGATLTFALGGRAGRITYETIVATGSLAANANGGEFTSLP